MYPTRDSARYWVREVDRPEVIERVLNKKNLIQNLVVALDKAGIEYEVWGAAGDPADLVTAIAENQDANFVVVGGRNQSSARRTLVGSVSLKILESVRYPVISVREGVYE